MNSRQRMIEAQARLITDLRKNITKLENDLERKIIEVERLESYAGFYKKLQSAILASPALQDEWSRFLFVLKLTTPEADEW